ADTHPLFVQAVDSRAWQCQPAVRSRFLHPRKKSRFAFVDNQATPMHLQVCSCLVNEGESGFLSGRSEEHTSELQSRGHLVCRLLLEKKKTWCQKQQRP